MTFLLALPGTVVGRGSAPASGRFVKSLLYETSTHDPLVLATVGATPGLIALSACIVPAVRINIAQVLRRE